MRRAKNLLMFLAAASALYISVSGLNGGEFYQKALALGSSSEYGLNAMITSTAPAVLSVYGEDKNQVYVWMGSGFIVNSQGYILTGNHVLGDYPRFSVTLADGTQVPATIVTRMPNSDIAILKIAGSGYPALPLGDSSHTGTGQYVLGLARGVSPTSVATGTITGRSVMGERDPQHPKKTLAIKVLQSSAQFYPGFSGSPLLNDSGQVVGVNVGAAVTMSNVSYSVPINDAKLAVQKALQRK